MILEPLNDGACLDQVTAKVRSWVGSKWAISEAAQYRSTEALAEHLRSEPQLDDPGTDRKSFSTVTADYPVRLRRDPVDPNCVERAAWYLAVAERLDPQTERALITVSLALEDGTPARHTAVVERHAGEWVPVDLAPVAPARRNVSGSDVAEGVLSIAHPIGAGIFGLVAGQYGTGAANWLGEQEQRGIGALREREGQPSSSSVDVHTGESNPPPTGGAQPGGTQWQTGRRKTKAARRRAVG